MPRRDLGDVAVTALTRPGVGSALLAGLGVYLVFVLPSLASTLVYVLLDRGYGQDPAAYLSYILPATLPSILLPPIPLSVGVVLAFWQIAPIAPELRMAHVVTRSLLAAVVGSILSGILAFFLTLTPRLTGPEASQYTPLRAVAESARLAAPGAFDLLFDALIAVPLAALLLWGWLQSHPPKATARGALDEV